MSHSRAELKTHSQKRLLYSNAEVDRMIKAFENPIVFLHANLELATYLPLARPYRTLGR